MSLGGVSRYPQAVQRMHGLETVEAFGHKNNIRMQSGNLFQTRVDSAADLGFILRVRGVIAEVRISDETILQAKRVDGFLQTRRERHDAANRLGDGNLAAGLARDLPEGSG